MEGKELQLFGRLELDGRCDNCIENWKLYISGESEDLRLLDRNRNARHHIVTTRISLKCLILKR